MNKVVMVVMAIFLIPVLSVSGKWIYDGITENYTFASTVTNLTANAWLVPYARSMWWIIPIGAAVIIILKLMKKEEPPMPQFPTFTQPRPPKQKKGQPPPNIFLGR